MFSQVSVCSQVSVLPIMHCSITHNAMGQAAGDTPWCRSRPGERGGLRVGEIPVQVQAGEGGGMGALCPGSAIMDQGFSHGLGVPASRPTLEGTPGPGLEVLWHEGSMPLAFTQNSLA